MKRIDTHLTEKQIAELKLLSKRDGLPVAELIRRAIDNFLRTQRKPFSSPKDKVKAFIDARRRGASFFEIAEILGMDEKEAMEFFEKHKPTGG